MSAIERNLYVNFALDTLAILYTVLEQYTDSSGTTAGLENVRRLVLLNAGHRYCGLRNKYTHIDDLVERLNSFKRLENLSIVYAQKIGEGSGVLRTLPFESIPSTESWVVDSEFPEYRNIKHHFSYIQDDINFFREKLDHAESHVSS